MHNIAIIGESDSVQSFKSLGIDTFVVNTAQDASHKLHDLAKKDYAIIYITEQMAVQISEDIDIYSDKKLPAIILIPGVQGSLGIGAAAVKKSVERAVGADILSKNN